MPVVSDAVGCRVRMVGSLNGEGENVSINRLARQQCLSSVKNGSGSMTSPFHAAIEGEEQSRGRSFFAGLHWSRVMLVNAFHSGR